MIVLLARPRDNVSKQKIKICTMNKCDKLKEKFYSSGEYDNDTVFLEMVEDDIESGYVVLDLGAGAGRKFPYDLKGKVGPNGRIVGADFDSRVCENPLLHQGVVLEWFGPSVRR